MYDEFYRIGIMQGRLLPKYKGRYQSHPVGYWQKEFELAAEIGLDVIEFILDYDEYGKNPLVSESGISEIRKVSEKTGIAVETICADYFTEAPIHSHSASVIKQGQEVLAKLIESASKIGISVVVIPCVDNSRLVDDSSINLFCKNIRPALEKAEKFSVNLALETDLAPTLFMDLLDKLDSPRVTVNYDTGNSASLGYDPVEELAVYGDRVSDIHIKDRVRDGGSVVLGTGATDFERFFYALARTDYAGPFIMQAYRDEEGRGILKKQLEWIKPKLQAWTAKRGKK